MESIRNLEDVAIEIVNILAKYNLSYCVGMHVLETAERIIEDQAKIGKVEK